MFCRARDKYIPERNNISLSLEKLLQYKNNQREKFVFPDRREGGVVVLTERSEVKTAPPDRERVKHSPEGFSFTAVTFLG